MIIVVCKSYIKENSGSWQRWKQENGCFQHNLIYSSLKKIYIFFHNSEIECFVLTACVVGRQAWTSKSWLEWLISNKPLSSFLNIITLYSAVVTFINLISLIKKQLILILTSPPLDLLFKSCSFLNTLHCSVKILCTARLLSDASFTLIKCFCFLRMALQCLILSFR